MAATRKKRRDGEALRSRRGGRGSPLAGTWRVGAGSGGGGSDNLLLEDGSNLLLEDGGLLILESAAFGESTDFSDARNSQYIAVFLDD